MAELLFKRGLYANLPKTPVDGTIYFTTDEGGMYIGVKQSDNSVKNVRIQGSVLYYDTLQHFAQEVQPPYSTNVLYFIGKSEFQGKETQYNALVRWDGSKWIQLNVTKGTFDALAEKIGDENSGLIYTVNAQGDRIATLEDWQTTINEWKSGALTETLNGLDERLETVETTVGDANSGLVKDVNDLKTAVGDANGGLVKDLADLEGVVEAIGDRTTVVETTLGDANSGLVQKVNQLDAKLGTESSGLTQRVGAIETAIADSTTGLNALSGRIDDANEDIAEVRQYAEGVSDVVGGVDTRVSALETWKTNTASPALTDHGNRIGVIEDELNAANNGLKARVTKAEERLTAIDGENGELATIKSDIEALQDNKVNVSDYQAHIGQYNTLAAAHEQLVTAHSKTSGDLATLTQKHTEDVESLSGSISKNAQDIEAHADLLSGLRTDLNAGVARISPLETSVEDHEGRLDEAEQLLDNTNKQALQNKADIATNAEAIEAANDSLAALSGLVKGDAAYADIKLPYDKTNIVEALTEVNGVLTTTKNTADQNKLDIAENASAIKGLQDALGLNNPEGDTTIAGTVAKLSTDLTNLTDRVTNLDKEDGRVEKLEDAVEDLNDTLIEKINAANAMHFINEPVGSAEAYATLLNRTDLSTGDTFVVSQSFAYGDQIFHAGDLLVASGTEDATSGLITSNLTFVLVETGYGSAHNLQLTLTEVAGAEHPTAAIQLTDKLNDNLGIVNIETTSANITIDVVENKISLGMAWDTF